MTHKVRHSSLYIYIPICSLGDGGSALVAEAVKSSSETPVMSATDQTFLMFDSSGPSYVRFYQGTHQFCAEVMSHLTVAHLALDLYPLNMAASRSSRSARLQKRRRC